MSPGEMIGPILVQLHQAVYAHWVTEELFSPRWWGMMALILFSYGLCFKLLDESRYTRILLFGALVAVSMGVVDTIGASFVLWSFKVRIFPTIPSVFLVSLTIIPFYYMLVYQYTSSWREFTVWSAVASGIISLVVFPLLAAINVVQLINWKYVYFWPIILFIGLLSRGMITVIAAREQKARERTANTRSSPSLVLQPALKPLAGQDDEADDE